MEREAFLERLRSLNDAFRRTFIGGAIIVSPRFEALDAELKSDILWRIRNFDAFEPNEQWDPENEHAYLALDYRGCSIVALIDYLSLDDPNSYSDDATDPAVTQRVLTVRFADERTPDE
jgi:hypothetical protein